MTERITPRLTSMTPFEVYLQRVNATFDSIRQVNKGMTYTPAQFGGIFGQASVANGGHVLELTTFEVT